jgi:hypothetical protein
VKKIRSGVRAMSVVGLAVVGLATLGVMPASAHARFVPVNSGGEQKGYAQPGADHLSFKVCDTKADGIGVYGRFKFQNGSIVDIVDPNGSTSGCGFGNTPSSNPVVALEAVWRGGATSGWVAS